MCRCRRLRGIGPKRMEDGFGAAHRTAGTPGARLRQVPPVTAAGYERGRKMFLMYLLRPCLGEWGKKKWYHGRKARLLIFNKSLRIRRRAFVDGSDKEKSGKEH